MIHSNTREFNVRRSKFRSLIMSPQHPHFIELLDVIRDEYPPFNIVKVAERALLPKRVVIRYVRWLKKLGNVKVIFYPSALGLGTLILALNSSSPHDLLSTLTKSSVLQAYKIVGSSAGILAFCLYPLHAYKAPLRNFIERQYGKLTEFAEIYKYSVPVQAYLRPFIDRGALLDSVRSLRVALNLSDRVMKRNLPAVGSLRSYVDAEIISLLESNALLGIRALTRSLKGSGIRASYKKVKLRLSSLVKDGVFGGFAFRSLAESSIFSVIFLRAFSLDELYDLVGTLSNYLYTAEIFYDISSLNMAVEVMASLRNVPYIIRFLKEHFNVDIIRVVPYPVGSTTLRRSFSDVVNSFMV